MSFMSFDSTRYWEQRYRTGGNSGRGSYAHLAQFKADIINQFLKERVGEIQHIVDVGVGDGNQLKLLDIDSNIKYTGLDVSSTVVRKCRDMFQHFSNFTFDTLDNNTIKADLVLSCDVLYHLIDFNIFQDHLDMLFSLSKHYVIIYAKDEDASDQAPHVLFRKFTHIIQQRFPQFHLIQTIPNQFPKESPSSFYIYSNNFLMR